MLWDFVLTIIIQSCSSNIQMIFTAWEFLFMLLGQSRAKICKCLFSYFLKVVLLHFLCAFTSLRPFKSCLDFKTNITELIYTWQNLHCKIKDTECELEEIFLCPLVTIRRKEIFKHPHTSSICHFPGGNFHAIWFEAWRNILCRNEGRNLLFTSNRSRFY